MTDFVLGLFWDCGISVLPQLVRFHDVISRFEQFDMTSKGAYVRVDRCYLYEFISVLLYDTSFTSLLSRFTHCTAPRYCAAFHLALVFPYSRRSEGILITVGRQPAMDENKGDDTGPAKHTIGMMPIPISETRHRG